MTALPFGSSVRRYAIAGLPAGMLAAAVAWDGRVSRGEGLVLVFAYVAFVAVIWIAERQPPTLGETGELIEAEREAQAPSVRTRVGRELVLVLLGVGAMAIGATALVEGIRRITNVESTQTKLGLVVVGFATAFELVVLAFSAARRGVTTAVVAGVIGSFTYNATMTLGAGALARPLQITDAAQLHGPWIMMLSALTLVIALSLRHHELARREGTILLATYPVFVVLVLIA